ncbi:MULTISPECIES: hypothetical protein [Paraburkholderia]|uniref:Uncharacterized protein n=1 Tax=Paraburkholderia tropica TaxID=92647 RepID=A0A1A5X880_9BURK|nr:MULTISPECIES: hypothetical protein [Paraburkholderia]MBB2978614.1 hypothetical protein [Paraburkholderia tropica]MBB2998807.1 hypothetical protein [Paraburkholderia tropica]MBB6318417.1 hypothetical protein [Paraburkholderia tropica]MDE1139338.1 hypothetical protein [Paraburkholderia tropica]OBR49736.1 hypothetical protein A6456_28150 [Paraburkholderia tropica]
MADAALNPALRQIAEQYLNRSLEAQEEATLLRLQQGFQGQAATPSATQSLDAVEQARRQVQAAIGQGQAQAASGMRTLLETIQTSSAQALEVQDREEQAILALLEHCKTLSDLRPAALNPELAQLQPGNQLALTQIAAHLAGLAKQEVEQCFNQQFGPLVTQLQDLIQRINAQEAAKAAPGNNGGLDNGGANAPAVPNHAGNPAAGSTTNAGAATQNTQTEQASGVHEPSGGSSMQ